MNNNSTKNAEKIQSILTDDLLATPQHISDVKQVLEYMENVAQPLNDGQVRALIYLQALGSNSDLHGDKNPYEGIVKEIQGFYKKAVAPVAVYLDTIQELVPKPPRPIVLAEKEGKEGKK